jgi:DNA-binding LytR/AlgR family response regulator
MGSIFIRSNAKLVRVKSSEILFVEALKDYVIVQTSSERYTIHSTMKDILAKLPQTEFVRVHRSFIVRLDQIAAIDYPNLILEKDKKMIPIGGSYKDELIARINLL